MMKIPRFSSALRLVPQHRFWQTKDGLQPEEITGDWTIDGRVSLRKQGLSDCAGVCAIGGLQNGERATLFHLIPVKTLQNWDWTQLVIEQEVQWLRQGGKTIRGLLTGGSRMSPSSRKLFNKLKALYERLQVPVTILWGAKNGNANVYVNAEADTWQLSVCHALSGKPVLDPEDLNNHFEQVTLADGDWFEASKIG